uniref:Glyco_hydro_38C domain-containing protein n=1 Tax=Echinostoma caproni TaxID=27848 RepID=A0A183BEF1_9TREM
LARGELQWKSSRKSGVTWIRDLTGSLTLRIFPPEYNRYFRVNFSHAIMENVLTLASVEFDSNTVYMLESTLYRGLPVHSLRLRWPPNREIVMNTTYMLQLGPKTAIAFKHVLAQNEDTLLGAIHTEILYHMETNKLLIRHNSTSYNLDGEPQLIAGVEWGNELHGKVRRDPLRIEFIASGLLQLQIPVLAIDSRLEALFANRFGPYESEMRGRLLYSRPRNENVEVNLI